MGSRLIAAGLLIALVAVGWMADAALRRQARAEERAVRADARGRARLLSASVRAELARIEEATAAGEGGEGVEASRLRIPAEDSVAAFSLPPYGERDKGLLAVAVGSIDALPSGLPEAVIAALALGGEEPRLTVGRRLIDGRLPVRSADLSVLAARLGLDDDPGVESLRRLLVEWQAREETPALPSFDRRLSDGELVGWSRSKGEALRYRLGLDELTARADLPEGVRLEALAEAVAVGRLLVDVEGAPGLVLSVPLAGVPGVLAWRVGLWLLVLLLAVVALLAMRALQREQGAIARERDFLTTVSHEMRTPLASVRVLGETLAKGRGDAREYGELIAREGLRLTALVEGVLAAARVGERASLTDVGPAALLLDVAELVRPRAAKRGIEFGLEIPELPPAHWDGEMVRRAVLGLLDNALRHGCSDGGRFSLSAGLSGEEIRISVADDGPGIGRSDVGRIRGRFERAGETAGTGLGLWLVEQAAAAHGGRLDLETEAGRGARFTLHLPLQPPVVSVAGTDGGS